MPDHPISPRAAARNSPPQHAPGTPSSDARHSVVAGIAFCALGAIAFSGKAIIVKLIYRYQVDAVTALMYRMLLALPLFVAMAWWAGRGKLPLARRDWLGVIGLGFSGYYLSSMLDFMGLQTVTASLERLILYLSPTVVMLLGWALRGRRITPQHLLASAVSYAGVLLVFGLELGKSAALNGATALGSLFVFLSMASYSFYLFYSGDMVKRLGSLRLTGLASTVACLLCIAQFALLKPLSAAWVVPPVIGLSVLNAVGCTAVPVLLVMIGIERLGPSLAAQIGMIGPLATIGMGVVLLGEPFTPWIAAGTALVVLGIFLFSRAGR